MKIDYDAHLNDKTGLLNSLHEAWSKQHPGRSPNANYSAWLNQKAYADKLIKRARPFIVLALLSVVGIMTCVVTNRIPGHHIGRIEGFFLVGFSIFIALALYWVNRSHNEFPEDPDIWDVYEEDLNGLIAAFPVIADKKVGSLQAAMLEIGIEIDLRARQVAAKQRAGFLVDAKTERDELLRLHEIPWRRFGIVKGLESFFPNDQAVG